MTVRLVKRGQQVESTSKQAQKPSTSQNVLTTTQSWVEEFRARKSSSDAALRARVKLG
jgi:hypothetical protein